jgi:5-methylcytosine-specific restriction endonuclease McrA
MTTPHHLTNDDLIAAIASLSAVERAATASLIAHLAELEARRLHLAQGFRSLFGYCRHVLHCSEAEAYNRMEAVHAARRFPVILALLAEGRLHLTAVRLLAPHLRDEDHLALLGGAIHKSRREIVALLAHWFPSPDVPSSIRKLPAMSAKASLAEAAPQTEATALSAAEAALLVEAASTSAAEPPGPEVASPGGSSAMARATRAAPRPNVVPLSADRYRLQVTLEQDAHDDLECLQDLMRREIPDGDPARIVARALKLLRREAQQKAFSETARPRPGRAARPESRDIPAHVQRAVWRRDDGQCAFEGLSARCPERSFLEFHHVRPWIAGGPPSAENIALRCRAHNAHEADVYFGPIRAAMENRDADSFRNESGASSLEITAAGP